MSGALPVRGSTAFLLANGLTQNRSCQRTRQNRLRLSPPVSVPAAGLGLLPHFGRAMEEGMDLLTPVVTGALLALFTAIQTGITRGAWMLSRSDRSGASSIWVQRSPHRAQICFRSHSRRPAGAKPASAVSASLRRWRTRPMESEGADSRLPWKCVSSRMSRPPKSPRIEGEVAVSEEPFCKYTSGSTPSTRR